MLLNLAMRRAAKLYPDNTATIFHHERRNYRELDARVHALASALIEMGLKPGDKAAIYILNSPRFLEVTYACFEAGIVIVPLNTRLAAEELVFIINDAECSAFITDEILQPLASAFKPGLKGVRHYISVNGTGEFIDYEQTLAEFAGHRTELSEVANGSDEVLAGLFYTSGTTGMPKGVMLSHRNIWMNALHTIAARPAEPKQVFLHAAPMFHLATFPAVINVTMNGGAHAMLQKFDLKELVEIIERDKVTSIVLVPTMINFLIHHPDLNNHDLSSLRRITYGASPMPVELLKKSMAAFPGCEFIQGYGQTESSPLLTTLMPEDHVTEGPASVVRRLASCGRPILGVEVEVVNDAGIPVKIGEVGEVVARGPNVMMGYWKRPEETEETLRGGWLHTGDLAIVDEAGYIYLVDRKKDMIISGGENVFSTEVENVIYTHPAIREAAVIGIPDEKWGEAVSAIVALKPGATLSDTELIDYCAGKLADYKVPKYVEIRDGELPKSGTGKILKKELREPYWQGKSRHIN